MSARACTECGAAASDAAERCEACGAPLEPRRLHEGSDLRVELERLGEALPSEVELPSAGWGRVSDHPGPRSAAEMHETASARSLVDAHERASGSEFRAADPIGIAQPTPSAELNRLLAHDIAVTPTRESNAGRGFHDSLTKSNGTQPGTARRPPVLASEALLRDLAPSRPARRALRIWSPVLGGFGACVIWLLTDGQGLGWPIVGAFVGLALLGLPPMPYAGRASAVATVAGTGLALLLWTDGTTPGGLSAVLLTVAVTMLAAGLYFRAWHRASALARVIVAAGVLLGALFLWTSGDLADLTLFDTSWQSWLPRLVGLSFGILLMFSLLAFMDARSTGGAAVWASFMLCWLGVHAAVEILHAAWPKYEASPDIKRIPLDTLLAWTSTPLLTALLALGLAQLLAAGLADVAGRPPAPTSRKRTEHASVGLTPVDAGHTHTH
jgi:hypothetical protein